MPAGFVFHNQAFAVLPLHHGFGSQGIKGKMNVFFLHHFRQRQGEHAGGIAHIISPGQGSVRGGAWFAVFPAFGGHIVPVSRGQGDEFVHHALGDLPTAAIAHGNEIVDLSQSRQAAQHGALFQHQHALSRPPGRQGRREPGDTRSGHNHVVCFLYGNLARFHNVSHGSVHLSVRNTVRMKRIVFHGRIIAPLAGFGKQKYPGNPGCAVRPQTRPCALKFCGAGSDPAPTHLLYSASSGQVKWWNPAETLCVPCGSVTSACAPQGICTYRCACP